MGVSIHNARAKVTTAEMDLEEALKSVVKNVDVRLTVVATISSLVQAWIEYEQTAAKEIEP